MRRSRDSSIVSRSLWNGRLKNFRCPRRLAKVLSMRRRRMEVVDTAVRRAGAERAGDVTASVAEAADVTDVPHRRLQHRRRKRIRGRRSRQRELRQALRRRDPPWRKTRRLRPDRVPAEQSGTGIAADAGTVGAENRRTEQPQRLRPDRPHRPETANNRRRRVPLGQRKRDPESSGKPVGSGLLFEGGSGRSPR